MQVNSALNSILIQKTFGTSPHIVSPSEEPLRGTDNEVLLQEQNCPSYFGKACSPVPHTSPQNPPEINKHAEENTSESEVREWP